MRALGWFLILAASTAGCATSKEPRVLRLDLEQGQKAIVWPQPPDVPRYAYVGSLVGEANFQRPGAENRRGVRGFLRWLAGIDGGQRTPLVLQRPQAGAVDEQGRVYVSDTSRAAVFVFDQGAGELYVWDKAVGAQNFISPAGVAPVGDGSVLVCDSELGFVSRLDGKGNPVGVIGKGELLRPTGIAYDATRKRIYVADTYAHAIKVFDQNGALLRSLGRRGEAEGEFNYPTHLALASGQLYVTDTMNNRVQVFATESDSYTRQLGARGLYVGNFVRPKGVAVDSEGNTYVVESYYDSLLVFSGGGEFLMPLGGTGEEVGRFYLPAGVWIDQRDRVFVADMFNGRVVVLQFLGSD